MEVITYKELKWYVINETNKEKLLLMKDCFTNEMIKKYFDEYDDCFYVKFNQDLSKIWWADSHIRKILNEKFILDLNKNDLNVMKTTLSLNGVISETKDYVRLLTIEEVRKIKETEKSILCVEEDYYGYWTMSPAFIDSDSCAYVYLVFESMGQDGWLDYHIDVNDLNAVRPVISLKNNTISDEEFKSEFRKYLSL